ncbi:integrator complex subunit 4-like [Biomphalaria glabrata]|uniref:Integrator complex subunit 4-like n=1 Tax=Biomphalaria glabrata TaxID=6526 RepID=A0A9W2Z279_BIOGL|nr:integrator complex subunit 4-like [Biomphalaria glabrata]
MAAKLKKRALAEFSYVVTEEPPQPVKKLRLIHQSTPPVISLNLSSSNSPQETIFLLCKLEESMPIDKEGAEGIYNELVEHLIGERDSIVRCKIISLFARLALVPGFNIQLLADDLLNRLNSETSHKVLSQMLVSAKTVSQMFSPSSPYIQRFMRAAFKNVSDSDHQVRKSCLQLIGCLASCEQQRKDTPASPDWPVSIQEVLTRYISDEDPRVRCSAFEAMLTLHNSGQYLGFSVYQQACSALSDDYEGVRLAAIQLIWVLSHLYPESLVPVTDSSEELRLVDDGFAKICNMVSDISVKVRVKACQLLGSLHLVSPKFLEQTLDKKIMSQLRRKRSAHERAREHFASGEWSTGQKWADDAPKEDIDPDSVNLLSIGACGAFVHGLEDEYLDVRNAALDSLCELASNSPQFSILSQDSIIDMFNDEIESVRLNAINSLRKISHNLLLREDQVEIILGVLQDFSPSSREALRDMLGHVKMATRACINNCVMAFLDNLQRYPQDRTSIWRCAQKLGTKHPAHVLALAPDLLCLHPYLDTPEPNMDDPAYITVLLLVFNAAAKTPTMVPLFQEHTRRHYSYLRSSLPDYVPVIKSLEMSDDFTTSNNSSTLSVGNTAQYLEELTLRLRNIENMDFKSVISILTVAVRDLERTKQLDKGISASADCTCVFLRSQLLLTKLLARVNDPAQCETDCDSVNSAVDKILQLTTKLQTVYLGLTSSLIWTVKQIELKALTLLMVVTLSCGSLADKIRMCETFKHYLTYMKKSAETESGPTDTVTNHLLSSIDLIDASHLQVTHSVLQKAINSLSPSAVPLFRGIRQVKATLEEPVENLETAIKMAAGLTAGLRVIAKVENIKDVRNVKIQVKYPDQQSQLISPPSTGWTRLSHLSHKLDTEIVMSHALWSEACSVDVSLVIEPCGQARHLLKKQEMVQLVKPVHILVSTKPHKI